MPISIQAPQGEGSEARAEARRLQAQPKCPGSFVTLTEDHDMVPSGRKLSAAQSGGARGALSHEVLEDTVAEALVVPEEMRGKIPEPSNDNRATSVAA
jgi:hypothetical protein